MPTYVGPAEVISDFDARIHATVAPFTAVDRAMSAFNHEDSEATRRAFVSAVDRARVSLLRAQDVSQYLRRQGIEASHLAQARQRVAEVNRITRELRAAHALMVTQVNDASRYGYNAALYGELLFLQIPVDEILSTAARRETEGYGAERNTSWGYTPVEATVTKEGEVIGREGEKMPAPPLELSDYLALAGLGAMFLGMWYVWWRRGKDQDDDDVS